MKQPAVLSQSESTSNAVLCVFILLNELVIPHIRLDIII